MSEPTATATRAAPPKAAGRKYLGLTRNQAIGVGAVFVGALAYILWRRHQASKTTATASTATSTSTSTASELAALEDALEQLQAQGYGGTAGGSGAVGTVGTSGASTGTGTTTSGSTGTQPSAPTTVTGAPAAPAPGAGTPITVTPVNLHTTQVSATSVGVAWVAPTIPAGQGPLTGYGCEVYTADGQSEGPSWTVPKTQLYANAGGLKSKTTYHLNVWCLPAKTGGPHASVSFTTK